MLQKRVFFITLIISGLTDKLVTSDTVGSGNPVTGSDDKINFKGGIMITNNTLCKQDETEINLKNNNCSNIENQCLKKICIILHVKDETKNCVSLNGTNDIRNVFGNINSVKQDDIEYNITTQCKNIDRYCNSNNTIYLFNGTHAFLLNGNHKNKKYLDTFVTDSNVSDNIVDYIQLHNNEYLKCNISDKNDNNEDFQNLLLRLRIYPYFLLTSVPFLILTSVIYTFIPELNNLAGKCLSSLTVTMTISFCLLSVAMRLEYRPKINKTVCSMLGYSIQYVVHSGYFWINVLCIDVWLIFRNISTVRNLTKQEESQKYKKYAFYAWGLPIITTLVILISDRTMRTDNPYRPAVGDYFCFMGSKGGRLVFYYVPLTFLLVINIILFAMTTRKICHLKKHAELLKASGNRISRRHKEWLNLYLKLLVVMGIFWATSPIANYFDDKPFWFWMPIESITFLQGIAIFAIYVCNKRVLRIINRKFYPSKQFFSSSSVTETNANLSTRRTSAGSSSQRRSTTRKMSTQSTSSESNKDKRKSLTENHISVSADHTGDSSARRKSLVRKYSTQSNPENDETQLESLLEKSLPQSSSENVASQRRALFKNSLSQRISEDDGSQRETLLQAPVLQKIVENSELQHSENIVQENNNTTSIAEEH